MGKKVSAAFLKGIFEALVLDSRVSVRGMLSRESGAARKEGVREYGVNDLPIVFQNRGFRNAVDFPPLGGGGK